MATEIETPSMGGNAGNAETGHQFVKMKSGEWCQESKYMQADICRTGDQKHSSRPGF
jgi:hypothetical protein